MSDERRLNEIRDVARLLRLDEEVSQDTSDVRVPCPLHADCMASGDNNLHLDLQAGRYTCVATRETSSLRDLIRKIDNPGGALVAPSDKASPPDVLDADFTETLVATNPVNKQRALVAHLTKIAPSPEEFRRREALRVEQLEAEQRRAARERSIIVSLAFVFLIAGLMAAGLSGFANYQAFASTVADPAQGRIWGAAGIIAAIVSFGGFTFVYWHAANRRRWESLRSLVFALIGAGASILGTEIYIHSNNLTAAAEVTSAATNRDVVETQVADWRRQLEGIPPETRSVEGLEAYIAEVERVGKTEQKPYRDAQNELGLAKRRDDLNAKIEAANAELLGQGSGNILLRAEQRAALPSWLFAVLLELFSSQATSIGLVALLILARRRPDQSATG